MFPKRFTRTLLMAIALVFTTSGSASADSRDLSREPDLKPLIVQGYGLRKATVVNDTTVQVVIGASSVEGRNDANNWRIVSTADSRYAYARFVNARTARTDSFEVEFARPEEVQFHGEWKRKNGDLAAQGASSAAGNNSQLSILNSQFPQADLPLTRSVVTLTVPYPLQQGVTYSIIAQGKGLGAVTCGLCAVDVTPGEEPTDRLFADEQAMAAQLTGLRRVGYLGDGKLVVECGPGYCTTAGRQPKNWHVAVNGHEVPVQSFGRRSKLECYQPEGWPFKGFVGHDLFLDLGTPLHDGDVVTVTADASVTAGCRTATLHYDEGLLPSRAIKVNQVGYLTDGIKVGYLGCWMGSMPEGDEELTASPAAIPLPATGVALDYDSLAPYALRFHTAPAFRLVDENSGATVWKGTSKLIHNGRYADGFINHAAENVYELDFGAFSTPGRYRLVVEGVGCSLPFDIADDIYQRAFKVQAQGIYTQRCGCPIDPSLSGGWERIACHDSGVMASDLLRHANPEHPAFSQHLINGELRIEKGELAAQEDSPAAGNNSQLSIPNSQFPKVLSVAAGHHDAGDYNPRSHIDVAQVLMNTYEMAPRLFTDSQLNVPERGNGIPDIVDEALWQVKLWEELQDEDGGVPGGTESEGDPGFTQTVELDDKGDYAWAKDVRGSYLAAGTFAQASRVLRSLRHYREARHYLQCARKAYDWAVAHPTEGIANAKVNNDYHISLRAYAACELYHTTHRQGYHDDFKALVPWTGDEQFGLTGNDRDMTLAAYAYLLLPERQTDSTLRKRIEAAVVREADFNIAGSVKMAYKFIRNPYAPITWGTGAYENYAIPVAYAWWLTGEDTYRDWLIRTCDNTLGVNPLGLSWITGLGQRTIRCPLHNSRYRPGGWTVDGLQAQGPNRNGDGYSWRETVYPPHEQTFAVMHAFSDLHYAIVMDEPTVNNMANTLMVFGLLSGKN